MLKKTVLILVLLALLLAACSPATQAPTPIPTRSSAKPTADNRSNQRQPGCSHTKQQPGELHCRGEYIPDP